MLAAPLDALDHATPNVRGVTRAEAPRERRVQSPHALDGLASCGGVERARGALDLGEFRHRRGNLSSANVALKRRTRRKKIAASRWKHATRANETRALRDEPAGLLFGSLRC